MLEPWSGEVSEAEEYPQLPWTDSQVHRELVSLAKALMQKQIAIAQREAEVARRSEIEPSSLWALPLIGSRK